ncbi:MAG: hypothetical protein IGS54_16115 [Elainella sp. C42_A2020_010]|nr:hypothetical protein [Elainella sp. C42_A2020_010]
MQTSELKFLLKLLGRESYRAPSVRELAPSSKTSASEVEKICRNLAEREIVGYAYVIRKFEIESAGKALLQQDLSQVPVSEQQLIVLKACKTKAIAPSDISSKELPAQDRQLVIQDLAQKGLVKAKKVEIKEVWLTDRGAEYLRDELNLTGIVKQFDLKLFGNYLNFMRKLMRSSEIPSELPPPDGQAKPTDEEILQTIRNLDRELGTENYLPIFYLRKKLQPPLSRDELDQALYRLQRQDKLDLSSLVEAIHYTSEEIQAGIPQESGGPLFFLVVNE